VPGYYESRTLGGSSIQAYFLSTTRNNLRVPVYSRLDIRANRTFSWRATRLTFFAEALNLYARENVRASEPGINGGTRQVVGLFDSMFPFIPSAGVSFEF
jgi:hypothetical protein